MGIRFAMWLPLTNEMWEDLTEWFKRHNIVSYWSFSLEPRINVSQSHREYTMKSCNMMRNKCLGIYDDDLLLQHNLTKAD